MDTRIDSAIANGKRIVIVVYSFQPKTEKAIQNTLETILKKYEKVQLDLLMRKPGIVFFLE